MTQNTEKVQWPQNASHMKKKCKTVIAMENKMSTKAAVNH